MWKNPIISNFKFNDLINILYEYSWSIDHLDLTKIDEDKVGLVYGGWNNPGVDVDDTFTIWFKFSIDTIKEWDPGHFHDINYAKEIKAIHIADDTGTINVYGKIDEVYENKNCFTSVNDGYFKSLDFTDCEPIGIDTTDSFPYWGVAWCLSPYDFKSVTFPLPQYY